MTDDLDAAIVAALITVHSSTRYKDSGAVAKIEKVRRPVISTAGASQKWFYFISRWTDYANATKITVRDFVLACHNFIIAVDHKPLLKIFADRSYDKIPRLKNIMDDSYTLYHIPCFTSPCK